TVRHRTDGEYAEHFRAVFEEAVRCRLRSHRPVGCEVSGGLDSSSVAVVANHLRQAGAAASPGLETVSMTFPGLPCDQQPYIQAVLRTPAGVPTHVLPHRGQSEDPDGDVRRFADLPDFPNGAAFRPLRARAHERGCRVLLTGLGGDEWLSRMPYAPAAVGN